MKYKSDLDLNAESRDLRADHRRNADAGTRFVNALIDGLAGTVITVILIVVLFFLISVVPDFIGGLLMLLIFLLYFLGPVFYYSVMEYKFKGKSLGKMVTNTTVIDIGGGQPSLGQIIGRSFARLIPLDFITLFFANPPTCIHDSVSNTRVVHD